MFDEKELHCIINELEHTASNKHVEARLRTIVNRIYYSVFLQARNYAGKKDNTILTNTGKSIHKETIKFYQNKSLINIANALSLLKKFRNDADYDQNKDYNYFRQNEKKIKRYYQNLRSDLDKLK
jgi:uncharacterized protein (UPF0332 family)